MYILKFYCVSIFLVNNYKNYYCYFYIAQVHAVKICGLMLQKIHADYLCIYPCIAMIIAYVSFLIPLMSSKFYTKKLHSLILKKKHVAIYYFTLLYIYLFQLALINIEKNMKPYISLLCYISTCSS